MDILSYLSELDHRLDRFRDTTEKADVRTRVKALVPVLDQVRKIGRNLVPGPGTASARERLLAYFRMYPQTKRANECHYNFAEIKFSLGDYERAAEEYMAVSKRYPDSKYRETAAWNAIVASQNLLKQEEAKRQ